MRDSLLVCKNSIGSSIVIICFLWCLFISLIREARVVDFHEPTPPVMSTRPTFLSEKLLIISGILRLSNSGIAFGITRNTRPKPFLCLKPFTRNRAYHSRFIEKSSSSFSWSFFLSDSGIIEKTSFSSSAPDTTP